jgi:hypothetical protein
MNNDEISVLNAVSKSVKLQIEEEKQLKFLKSIQGMMDLANKIQEIDTTAIEQTLDIFFNFPHQKLNLLDEPIEEIEPTFYRPHINNMIIVPKFVNKDK